MAKDNIIARQEEQAAEEINSGKGSENNFIANVLGESPSSSIGNPYARYLSRSILLEEANPPKNVRAVMVLFSLFLFSLIVISAFLILDERAVAPGEILPINFVQPVQHLEGGIVAEVLVVEDQLVEAGEIVLIMDETAPRAEFESLRARYAALSLQVERLRAYALERPADFSEFAGDYPVLVNDQRQILTTQVAAREAQVSVINAQVSEKREQLVGLMQQEEALVLEAELMQQDVDIRSELSDKGLSSRLVFLSSQRELARVEGDLAGIRTEIASARAAITESTQRVLELEERLRNESFREMGRISSEQAQVGAQLARLEDRVRRSAIVAPISGRIQGLTVTQGGAVLPPGAVIAEVVPESDEMIAEVRISPRDIGHIREGADVLVKVDTFNYSRWGGIKGTLQTLSASSFRDEEGLPYFRATVRLEKNYVGSDPRANYVTPGMTLVADVKTGEKTLIEYLLRPIYNTISASFGER